MSTSAALIARISQFAILAFALLGTTSSAEDTEECVPAPDFDVATIDDSRVSLEELEARLRSEPPPSVVVRAEESSLARVIAIAHGAGVHDIQLAYAVEGSR